MLHALTFFALMAMSFLPKALAAGQLTIWVAQGEERDTVLEVPMLDQDTPDIYAIDYEPSKKDTKVRTWSDGIERTYYRLYTEEFTEPTAYRPVTFRRGTKEQDGGHVTEVSR